MATGTLVGLGLGALALSAGATVASGVMGKKSQEEANATNIQLSREQMAYQTSEREAVQEYNTPANQRARFEQAGINPYMALGNINSGNAEMQTGVTPAQVQPVNALAQMVESLGRTPQQALNVVQQAQQVQAMQEANEQAHIESLYKEREKIGNLRLTAAKVSEALSNVSKTSQEYKNLSLQYQELENQIKISSIEAKHHEAYVMARNQRERNTAELVHQQERNAFYEQRIKEINANYADALNQADLSKLRAAAASEWASAAASHRLAALYTEQGKTEFASRVYKVAGLRLDNEAKNISNSYLGDVIRSGLDWNSVQIRQGKQDIENPFRYFGAGLGAMLGAGMAAAGSRTVVGGFR